MPDTIQLAVDAIRHQLDVADSYAKAEKRPSEGKLPSVWEIQNSHLRDAVQRIEACIKVQTLPVEWDEEIKDFLNGVVGVVEATSFEKNCLWKENNSNRALKRSWIDSGLGYSICVGYISDRPVGLSVKTSVIAGSKILFIDATSQVVDSVMIEEWLKENLPKTAFRDDGYINKTDATNFHVMFQRVV